MAKPKDGGLINYFRLFAVFCLSRYLYTPSSEENDIQLPFSTVATLPKNKLFDNPKGAVSLRKQLLGFYIYFSINAFTFASYSSLAS